MKRKTKILLIAITVMVCLICLVNAAWLIIQSGCITGFFASNNEQVQWNDEVIGIQQSIFWGRLLTGLIFDALLIAFMFKSLLALKSGILFPKANALILVVAAAVNLLYNFCDSNIGIVVESDRMLVIDDKTLLLPLILTAFALIYSLAAKISEENRLTI